MFRKLVMALMVCAVVSGSLLAEELRGTIKSISQNQNTVVLTVGDQDRTIEVGQNIPVYGLVTVGRRRRVSTQLQQFGQGLNALQPGMLVNMTTETRGGVEKATQITQEGSYGGGSGGRRRGRRR